ncbi:MAG: metallophosphoesterase [archaeon]
MNLLVFADVHGDIGGIKKIISIAAKEKASAMVCAGDLTFFGSNLEQIAKKFQSNIPLVLIPGNHELPQDIKNLARKFKFIKDIHNSAFEIDSCTILGLGGSKITPFSTPFEMDDKKIAALLEKFNKKGKFKKTVLVVHEPPFNTTLDIIEGAHRGSAAIRKFIEEHQPDYCICGHFHENAGKKDAIGRTIVINPGASGKIIKI